MKIAFLGLGTMGLPMATRLVAAGHDVTTWNRGPGRTVPGAASATSPGEAAEDVVLAADLAPGTVLVEMSTIGPDAVVALATRLPSTAAAKLVVNTALIGGLALLGELRELADRFEVDADLLAHGPMSRFVTRARGEGAHFTTALAAKDLTLLGDRAGPLTRAALARLSTTPPAADLGVLADPQGRS